MAEKLMTPEKIAEVGDQIAGFNSKFIALQSDMRDGNFDNAVARFSDIKDTVLKLESNESVLNVTMRLRPAIQKCDSAKVAAILQENAIFGMENGLNLMSLAQFLVIDEVRNHMLKEHKKKFNKGIGEKIAKMASTFKFNDDDLAYTASTLLTSELLSERNQGMFDSVMKEYCVPLAAVRPAVISRSGLLLRAALTPEALTLNKKYGVPQEIEDNLLTEQLAQFQINQNRVKAKDILIDISIFPKERYSRIKKEAGKIAIKKALRDKFDSNKDLIKDIRRDMCLSNDEVVEAVVGSDVLWKRREVAHLKVQERQQTLMDALRERSNLVKSIATETGIPESMFAEAFKKANKQKAAQKQAPSER